MITALAGGVGAARMLRGLIDVVDANEVTAIVNTGDDAVFHGLHVSPDLDTVMYTLAGAINTETGWGLAGETWRVMESLRKLGGVTWFNLGDQDLATHCYRTQRMREGAGLSEITAELCRSFDVAVRLLPVTEDPLRTKLTVEDGSELAFQEYFVRHHHDIAVRQVRFEGAEASRPGPGVLDAIAQASRIVLCPSNPIVSIGPLLAVPGVRSALEARRDDIVGVSPIIAGAALKGPADRLLTELGMESTVVGVARLYAPWVGTLVIDEADAHLAAAVEAEGMRCVVTPTVMSDPARAAALARVVLDG